MGPLGAAAPGDEWSPLDSRGGSAGPEVELALVDGVVCVPLLHSQSFALSWRLPRSSNGTNQPLKGLQ